MGSSPLTLIVTVIFHMLSFFFILRSVLAIAPLIRIWICPAQRACMVTFCFVYHLDFFSHFHYNYKWIVLSGTLATSNAGVSFFLYPESPAGTSVSGPAVGMQLVRCGPAGTLQMVFWPSFSPPLHAANKIQIATAIRIQAAPRMMIHRSSCRMYLALF